MGSAVLSGLTYPPVPVVFSLQALSEESRSIPRSRCLCLQAMTTTPRSGTTRCDITKFTLTDHLAYVHAVYIQLDLQLLGRSEDPHLEQAVAQLHRHPHWPQLVSSKEESHRVGITGRNCACVWDFSSKL